MSEKNTREKDTRAGMKRLLDEAAGNIEESDERWQALCEGEVGDAEREALAAEARDSAEADRMWQAYRPIDAAGRQQLLAKVQEQLARSQPEKQTQDGPDESPEVTGPRASESATEGPDGAGSAPFDDEQSRRGRGAGNVIAFPSRAPDRDRSMSSGATESEPDRQGSARSGSSRLPRWVFSSVAALAAAVLAIVLWPRPPILLPDYNVNAQAANERMRGPSPAVDEELTLRLGDSFEIFLVPAAAVDTALDTAVYVRRADSLEPVGLSAELSPTGSVKLEGRMGADLLAGEDSVELWTVVAAEGALPGPEQLIAAADQTPQPTSSWRLLRCRLQLDTATAVPSSE